VDLEGFLDRRVSDTGLVETAELAARASGKRHPAQCSRKTRDKFAIASMAKTLHICACTSACAFFAESMHAFLTAVVGTMHVQVYFRQML